MHASEPRAVTTLFCFRKTGFSEEERFKAAENSFIRETSSSTLKLLLSCHGCWQRASAILFVPFRRAITASLTARLLWPSVPLPEGQGPPSLRGTGAKTWLQRALGCAVRLLVAGLVESPHAGGGRFALQWGMGGCGSVSCCQGKGLSLLSLF